MNVLLRKVVMHGISQKELAEVLSTEDTLVKETGKRRKKVTSIAGEEGVSPVALMEKEMKESDNSLAGFRGDPATFTTRLNSDVIRRNKVFWSNVMDHQKDIFSSDINNSFEHIGTYGRLLAHYNTSDKFIRSIDISTVTGIPQVRNGGNSIVKSTAVSVFLSVIVLTVMPKVPTTRNGETGPYAYSFPKTTSLDLASQSPDFPIKDMSIQERIEIVQKSALAILADDETIMQQYSDVVSFLNSYYDGSTEFNPVISTETFTVNLSTIIASPLKNEVGVTHSYLSNNGYGRPGNNDHNRRVGKIRMFADGHVDVEPILDDIVISGMRTPPFSPIDLVNYVSLSNRDLPVSPLTFVTAGHDGGEDAPSSSQFQNNNASVAVIGQPISLHEDIRIQHRVFSYLAGVSRAENRASSIELSSKSASNLLQTVVSGGKDDSIVPVTVFGPNTKRPADIPRVGWGYITKHDIALRVGNTRKDTLITHFDSSRDFNSFINKLSTGVRSGSSISSKLVEGLTSEEGLVGQYHGSRHKQRMSTPLMSNVILSSRYIKTPSDQFHQQSISAVAPVMRASLSDEIVRCITTDQGICPGSNLFINGRYSKQSRDIWNSDIGWIGNNSVDSSNRKLSSGDVNIDWVVGACSPVVFLDKEGVLHTNGSQVLFNSLVSAVLATNIGDVEGIFFKNERDISMDTYTDDYEGVDASVLEKSLLLPFSDASVLSAAPIYVYKYAMGEKESGVVFSTSSKKRGTLNKITGVRLTSLDSWRLVRKVSRLGRTTIGAPALDVFQNHIEEDRREDGTIGALLRMGEPMGIVNPILAVRNLQSKVLENTDNGYVRRALYTKYLLSDRMLIWDSLLGHMSSDILERTESKIEKILLMDLAFRTMTIAFINDLSIRMGVLTESQVISLVNTVQDSFSVLGSTLVLEEIIPMLNLEEPYNEVKGYDMLFTARRPVIFDAVCDAVSKTRAKWAVDLFLDMIVELTATDINNGVVNQVTVAGV